MINKFQDYIQRQTLFTTDDRILLGVSGGVDSMVMLDLFIRCGYEIGVAHCNFNLRGQESDREETLVRQVAAENNLPFHVVHFDTMAESTRTGESIQMAARRLRYEWFGEICTTYNYDKVAIAHHGNDSTETFFINLIRGTGLRGITGISSTNGRIVRPLLFAHRDTITWWASENGVRFLNDSSNGAIKYLRNRLRHDILPRLADTSNSFMDTMADNIARLEQAQRFIDNQMVRIRNKVMENDNVIEVHKLKEEGDLNFLLFEILRPYGFAPEVIEDLVRSIDKTGKQFISPLHIASLDRGRILITERKQKPVEEETLSEDDPRIEWLTINDFSTLITPSNIALLSADSLQFPLKIRKWRSGEWFIPLGMHSQKLVSDYLIDAKVPLIEKERQTVLLSGNSLIWLIGRRIDDRYKVTERTKRVVRITL